MRIAQVMAGAPNGGAELFFERMTVALAQSGETVLPLIRTDARRAGILRAAGLAPQEFRFGGKLDILTTRKLRDSLKTFKADLAIAWMSRAALHLPQGDWINIGRLGGYYDLKYFRSCLHLVGNTRGIVDWIAGQGWAEARVHYLPNFVGDFSATPPADRAGLGVPPDAPLLLGLGRLHDVKGFDVLIRAISLLPDASCVIAGEGPERNALQKLIDELHLGNRVKLLGWRSDSGALLKAADIFVSSSRHEPLGNMVLEAFSAARPVLAARAEGPVEVIRDGEDGMLVPINDPAALADAAKILLGDAALRTRLAQQGRARFEREFAEAPVLAAWQDFFAKVTA